MHTGPLTSGREPVQRNSFTKKQFGEPAGVAYSSSIGNSGTETPNPAWATIHEQCLYGALCSTGQRVSVPASYLLESPEEGLCEGLGASRELRVLTSGGFMVSLLAKMFQFRGHFYRTVRRATQSSYS